MAMTDIFISVSTSLNDQEPGFQFLRWPVSELTGYFNEGMLGVFKYRPDVFTYSGLTFPLIANQANQGIATVTVNGVTPSLLKSIDYNDPNGSCGAADIVECDLALMRTFYKAPCGFTGGPTVYRVLSYAYDARSPLAFYVSPIPPSGVSVRGTAVVPPPTYVQTGGGNSLTWTPGDLTTGVPLRNFTDTIKFWMLARAYEVDTESSTSQAESEKYYKKFYNDLGVDYKQVSSYNKGQYIGQGGDQNMTKQRVA